MARNVSASFNLGGKAAVTVLSFTEQHVLGVPCEATVSFLFSDSQKLDDLVGQQAVLEYMVDEDAQPRVFGGIVESISVEGSSQAGFQGRTFQYEARVVSLARLLDRSRQTRIFQALDVKGIVAQMLTNNGIASDKQEWKLSGSYPVRDYCVQYQESDLAFVSRLLEQEGIYFGSRFDPQKGELLFFADDSTAALPIDGDEKLPFRRRSGVHVEGDHVHDAGERQRVVSDKFTLRDFNFETPQVDLTCQAVDGAGSLEVYDYPGGYGLKADGSRLATARLEAELATRHTMTVEAECTRISVGRSFDLEGTGALEVDGKWFVVSVVHEFDHGDGEHPATYVVRAEVVPSAVKYRPPRVTPKPVIEGPQTAKIVGPAGTAVEGIHTDEHGRVKVKFAWDLADAEDDKATFWMRTSQLQTSGSMILPRWDWEVIVEFLEGDPDRPIVSGRAYNGQYMPPYELPAGKTRTAFKTVSTPGGGGANEIRFEDKSGSEEIMIHSQFDTNITVANDKTKDVGNSETQNVKVNSTMSVGANQTVKITKGSESSVGSNQSVTVGGNRSVGVNAVTTQNIAGKSTNSVGGNQMEMIGNPLEAILALAVERAAEVATAKANEALKHVEKAVQGKLDQAMGPIKTMTDQAKALGDNMNKVAGGNLGAVGGLLAGATALPTAAVLAASLSGGGGEASKNGEASKSAEPAKGGGAAGGVPAATTESAQAMLHAAAGSAIQKGIAAGKGALSEALGLDAAGGGGASMANAGGPKGDVKGVDVTDRTKGPGHSTSKVAKTFKETVATAQITAAVNGVITNIAKDATRSVGAAQVKMAYGDVQEAVAANKSETALGLVVVTKGSETEAVKGARTGMVGGAILDLVNGNRAISAGAAATYIGAFHKIEAQSSITFKCGGSSIVIDGSGITMKSMAIMFLGAKQAHTKAVGEGG